MVSSWTTLRIILQKAKSGNDRGVPDYHILLMIPGTIGPAGLLRDDRSIGDHRSRRMSECLMVVMVKMG